MDITRRSKSSTAAGKVTSAGATDATSAIRQISAHSRNSAAFRLGSGSNINPSGSKVNHGTDDGQTGVTAVQPSSRTSVGSVGVAPVGGSSGDVRDEAEPAPVQGSSGHARDGADGAPVEGSSGDIGAFEAGVAPAESKPDDASGKGADPVEDESGQVEVVSSERGTGAAEAADSQGTGEFSDPYEIYAERHREMRERLVLLTQPRASVVSERSNSQTGGHADQRSYLSRLLRDRDPRLFICANRRPAKSFLPPLFKQRFMKADSPKHTHLSSQRRSPEEMLERSHQLERAYSSKKHRMHAEQVLERRVMAERCKLPMLSRATAHCHRSELHHNFCVDVLERGCHQAHAEMYHLLRRADDREGAPPAPPLRASAPKLQKLKQGLIDMEEAVRDKNFIGAYAAASQLAFFFLKDASDLWLASHFFDRSLTFAKKVDDDGKMRESEAYCNVGIMHFFEGRVDEALEHLERFRRQSYRQHWETADGHSYYRYSCLLLQDVYLSLAIAAEQSDLERAFKLYLRASVMANQAANLQAEALAQYNLGEIQEKMANWPQALRRYETYLRLSDKLLNFTGVCTGCFKIAKCNEALGNLTVAVDHLKRSEHIARGQHLDDEIVRASSELGHIYLSMGKHELAYRQFTQSYQYVEQSESVVSDDSYAASAMVGISSAGRLLPQLMENVYIWREEEIATLLLWKTARRGLQATEPPPTLREVL